MKYDRSKIIRKDDNIKIVNPFIFKRVGYPLTKEDVKQTISEEEKKKIADLLGEKYWFKGENIFNPHIDGIISYKSTTTEKVYDEILDRLAYYKLKKLHFGGNKRDIHTEFRPELKNQEFRVTSKRFVKTGDYYCGGYSYDDYQPPVLYGEKTRILLGFSWEFENLEIEACHVEKVDILQN